MRSPRALAAAVAVALCAVAGVRVASAAQGGMGMYVGKTALPWVENKVEVDVALGLARGEVRQVFRNTTGQVAEAVYVFPLPTGAAVTAMRITVGGTTITGAVAPRADAVRRYEDAVGEGRAAGLIERERPGVYTQSIAGIPIDGTVEVTLAWQARLERHAGGWELAHPMVIGPRYVPGRATGAPTRGGGWSPDTDRAPDASRVTPPVGAGARTPFAFTVRVAGADALESPSHELSTTTQAGVTTAQVTDARGDRELVVRWKGGAEAAVRAIAEPAGTGAYVAVLIEAAPEAARPRGAARTWLVAIDRASSLDGAGRAQARQLAQALLDRMRPDDRFALVAVGQPARFVRATAAERNKALTALERAPGTDDLTAGLAATLAGLPPAATTSVVLVTDGLVADDAAAITRAAAAGVTIHPVGVGAAPNRWLLEAIALRTGGVAHVLTSPDEAPALAAEVIAAEAAQPVSVDWRKPSVEDAEPARAVVVPGGATLIVAVDRKGVPSGEVEVAIGARRLRATIERGTGTGLATEWARLRVARLWAGGDARAATTLAVERGIVGPTTALVAVAATAGDPVRSTVTVPVPAPAGVRRDHRRRAGEELDLGGTADRPVAEQAPPRPTKKPAPPREPRREPTDKDDRADVDGVLAGGGGGAGPAGGDASGTSLPAPPPPPPAPDGAARPAPAPATAPEPAREADEAEAPATGAADTESIVLTRGQTSGFSLTGRPLDRHWLTVGVDLGARVDDPAPAARLGLGLHRRIGPRLVPALRLDLTAAPSADQPVVAGAVADLGVRAFDRLVLDVGVGLGWAGELGLAFHGGLTFDVGKAGVGVHATGVRAEGETRATVGAGLELSF